MKLTCSLLASLATLHLQLALASIIILTSSPAYPLPATPSQLLAFESFRDVVALEGKGYSEPKGLAAAEADLAELRAAARVSAAASSSVGTTRQQQQAAAGMR